MSIYKRGRTYWYKFMWNGELVRESTKQANDRVARQMESAHRTSLAKGEVGLREKKVAPSLSSFCDDRFEPWAKATLKLTPRSRGYGIAPECALSYRTRELRIYGSMRSRVNQRQNLRHPGSLRACRYLRSTVPFVYYGVSSIEQSNGVCYPPCPKSNCFQENDVANA